MNADAITINVPAHLVEKVGATHSVVYPIHTVGSSLKRGGLVLVHEPRRNCEYWISQSQAYPAPSRRW